jgi:hypothetical protein
LFAHEDDPVAVRIRGRQAEGLPRGGVETVFGFRGICGVGNRGDRAGAKVAAIAGIEPTDLVGAFEAFFAEAGVGSAGAAEVEEGFGATGLEEDDVGVAGEGRMR